MSVTTFPGIDGEGKGRNPHLYTLLAVAAEGKRHCVEDQDGLSTLECLKFIISLPYPVVFAFSFGYDLTMILKDLPNESIYKLLRPQYRKTLHKKTRFIPVEWEGFKLDYVGTQFSVRYKDKCVTIWDVFKFFQSSYVKALKLWKVGEPEVIAEIERMKDERTNFDKLTPAEIREYCFLECELLGPLVRKLTDTHKDVGLDLTSYHGAGSSASALLNKIKPKRAPIPKAMIDPVYRAYFGGRFENSYVGHMRKPIYNYDISSAYPYQLYRLPCLEHAFWEYTTNEKHARSARAALVHWHIPAVIHRESAWGPFPFRTKEGNIIFPVAGGHGWVWQDEFFAGKQLCPEVEFCGAWCMYTDCNCRPFQVIPEYYRWRVAVGKDGKGIVLKLAYNACYGKIAQLVGSMKWSNRVWAGMITSNTRGQIIADGILRHENPWNLLAIATDGIYTLERLNMPKPDDTGTFDLQKPLGGWEEKVTENGMFFARPGINFPYDRGTPDDVKARGFGRKALYNNADRIMDHWDRWGDRQNIVLPNIQRFYGAKTCIWKVEHTYRRSPSFGSWFEYEPEMSFAPQPKRARILADGRLEPHRMNFDSMSKIYIDDPEIIELQFQEDIENEQP